MPPRMSSVVADGFGGFEGAAAPENGEAPEEGALILIEQVVAPRDRRVQGAVTVRAVDRAAGQEGQGVLQSVQQRLR